MSELSNLVKFRNDLVARVNELSLTAAIDQRVEILNSIKNINPNVPIDGVFDQYLQEYKELEGRNKMIVDSLISEVAAITQRIDDLAKQLFDTAEHQELFTEGNIHQQFVLDNKSAKLINTLIGSYCSWSYPSLVLFPRGGNQLMQTIVASDPLYIVYRSIDDIITVIEDFSDEYKSRIRLYSNLEKLPQNQFGFVLLWNWLNYLSIDKFEDHFQQIYNLLKPGGSCMFSYNNCDLPDAAERAVKSDASYANIRLVKRLVERIGFKVIKSNDLATGDDLFTYISWMEIQKPGTLTTVKAHQALGEIIKK
jgi:SAM-dependent methyltransferase